MCAVVGVMVAGSLSPSGLRAPPATPAPTGSPSTAPADGPQVILFVGNSFSHGKYEPVRLYNRAAVIDENYALPQDDPRSDRLSGEHGPHGGIPGLFKKFADEAGRRYEVHVDAVSATSLGFHYQHALPLIAQPKWNAVVLQEYSTVPLPAARGGRPAHFLTDATHLEQAVHAANPAARLYLYETWPRADVVYPENASYHGEDLGVMGADLHDAYQRVYAANGHFAGVAWVGDAWMSAIRTGAARANPYADSQTARGFDLWGPDHYHPSVHGAYLAALVLFQQITGVAPRTLGAGEEAARDLGLSSSDAVELQQIAETSARSSADAR